MSNHTLFKIACLLSLRARWFTGSKQILQSNASVCNVTQLRFHTANRIQNGPLYLFWSNAIGLGNCNWKHPWDSFILWKWSLSRFGKDWPRWFRNSNLEVFKKKKIPCRFRSARRPEISLPQHDFHLRSLKAQSKIFSQPGNVKNPKSPLGAPRGHQSAWCIQFWAHVCQQKCAQICEICRALRTSLPNNLQQAFGVAMRYAGCPATGHGGARPAASYSQQGWIKYTDLAHANLKGALFD